MEKLNDYVENHPKKFFPEMYATFLWQNSLEKEVFFYYQLHVYEGKLITLSVKFSSRYAAEILTSWSFYWGNAKLIPLCGPLQ